MKLLEPPDTFHLQAAEGWLGLGDYFEADAELAKITLHRRTHPEVLNLRWNIYAAGKQWDAALDIALFLIQLDPEDPLGWVYQSRALHALKRTREARDNLMSVVDKFPTSVTVLYDLACYECKMDNLKGARRWLTKAFQCGRAGCR